MTYEYWQKQDIDKPLFEDLIWSKPQHKSRAGKLLIIGGNTHGIAAPGEAYEIAKKQGVGECKVAIPSSTRKLFGQSRPLDVEFVESTLSGSLSTQAEISLKSYISWADATLFAGNFSSSSETAVLLEKLAKNPGIQVYTGDCLDYFLKTPLDLLQRQDTLLVLTIPELQKFAINTHFDKAFTFTMDLLQLIEILHNFTLAYPCQIITEHQGQVIATLNGQVVSTKLSIEPKNWQIKTATASAVWWLQNPNKPLKSIVTAISQLDKTQ